MSSARGAAYPPAICGATQPHTQRATQHGPRSSLIDYSEVFFLSCRYITGNPCVASDAAPGGARVSFLAWTAKLMTARKWPPRAPRAGKSFPLGVEPPRVPARLRIASTREGFARARSLGRGALPPNSRIGRWGGLGRCRAHSTVGPPQHPGVAGVGIGREPAPPLRGSLKARHFPLWSLRETLRCARPTRWPVSYILPIRNFSSEIPFVSYRPISDVYCFEYRTAAN